ncbi:GlcG/HbpS family heme-binding protein [Puia sp. P3]|uniref:GlcG/HbpS family heme-binding protein n=1 Tax=Puia sp. P3 TaxID=3423952 RepID=UPI003D6795BD
MLTLGQARRLLPLQWRKAKQLNLLMNIAVFDSGVNLVAFVRMDDAWLGAIDLAMKKARTARYFNMESWGDWEVVAAGGTGVADRAIEWWPW